MEFNKYITKKRTRIRGITGIDFNIPALSVCEVFNKIIYYKKMPVCFITSQNTKDYFWGYDENNPEYCLKRNRAMDKLKESEPNWDKNQTKDFIRAWEQYGEMEDLGVGLRWKWNENTLYSSFDNIEYLLKCIKEDKAPFSLLRKGD